MIIYSDCQPNCNSYGFCKYFDFDTDEQGQHTDDGWCNLHKEESDSRNNCSYFSHEEAIVFSDVSKTN